MSFQALTPVLEQGGGTQVIEECLPSGNTQKNTHTHTQKKKISLTHTHMKTHTVALS